MCTNNMFFKKEIKRKYLFEYLSPEVVQRNNGHMHCHIEKVCHSHTVGWWFTLISPNSFYHVSRYVFFVVFFTNKYTNLLLFLHNKICCRYSFQVPGQSTSYEYIQ